MPDPISGPNLPVSERAPPTLRAQTVRGLVWNFLARGGQQFGMLVIVIVLARLLEPEHFGLVAMLTVFITLGHVITSAGFAKALIQKQDADDLDASSMFYFNVGMAFLLWLLLSAASPLIAAFYRQPDLIPLLIVASLAIVVGSAGLIHTTLLSKKLDFKTLLKATWISTVIGGAIGIGMAISGMGAWSLVGHTLGAQTTLTLALWALHPWRPRWQYSWQRMKKMLPYGSNLLAAESIGTFFKDIYVLMIGRMYLPADVGFYQQANRLQQFPIGNIVNGVNQVMFPVFSRVQNEPHRLWKAMRKSFQTTCLAVFPLMGVLIVVADPLLPLLLGEKWMPAVPLFQILCFGGMLYPVHASNLSAIKAVGRSDVILRLNIIKHLVVIAILVVTIRFGLVAIAWGQATASFVAFYINAWYNGRLLKYGFARQVIDLAPFALATALMMGGAWAAGHAFSYPHDIVKLAIQVLCGALIFVAACTLMRLEAWWEALQVGAGLVSARMASSEAIKRQSQ